MIKQIIKHTKTGLVGLVLPAVAILSTGCSSTPRHFDLNKEAVRIGSNLVMPGGYEIRGYVKTGDTKKEFKNDFGRVYEIGEDGKIRKDIHASI